MFRVPEDCQIPDPIERRDEFTLDQIYEYYFKDLNRLEFVEVGAYDGETHSNTCLLADDGWRGIYIEPVEDYYKLCKERHKSNDVQVIQQLISDTEDIKFLNINKEWTTVSDHGIALETKTLDTVLSDVVDPGFNLLILDVEDHELSVLKGFDLKYWSPIICIIEMHEQPSPTWLHVTTTNMEINNLMFRAGYTKIYFDYINTIFVRNDFIESRGNFFENIDNGS